MFKTCKYDIIYIIILNFYKMSEITSWEGWNSKITIYAKPPTSEVKNFRNSTREIIIDILKWDQKIDERIKELFEKLYNYEGFELLLNEVLLAWNNIDLTVEKILKYFIAYFYNIFWNEITNEQRDKMKIILEILIKEVLYKMYINLSKWRLVGEFKSDKGALKLKLRNIKYIYLGQNKSQWKHLSTLSNEELWEIFSCLWEAIWFDLTWLDLTEFSQEQIQEIFSHLNNSRIINLINTNLSILNKDKLEIIFSNTTNVENWNFIWLKISDEILSLIAKYANKTRKIDFSACELTEEQQNFIKKAFSKSQITF